MTKELFLSKLGTELGIPPNKLTDSVELSSFPAWDSMGRMAVVAMLDTELNFEVPPGGLLKCKTVGHLVGMLGDKLKS